MSCLFCSNYNGLQEPCSKGVTIKTTMEDMDCKHYEYNKGLWSKK